MPWPTPPSAAPRLPSASRFPCRGFSWTCTRSTSCRAGPWPRGGWPPCGSARCGWRPRRPRAGTASRSPWRLSGSSWAASGRAWTRPRGHSGSRRRCFHAGTAGYALGMCPFVGVSGARVWRRSSVSLSQKLRRRALQCWICRLKLRPGGKCKRGRPHRSAPSFPFTTRSISADEHGVGLDGSPAPARRVRVQGGLRKCSAATDLRAWALLLKALGPLQFTPIPPTSGAPGGA
jgi:hypothetical protein